MTSDAPNIRFFTNSTGEKVAYALHGEGPPLVVPAWWVSHLELDWHNDSYREFFLQLGTGHTVIRYDRPGVGLSDRGRKHFTLEDEFNTLAELIDTLELPSCTLLGISCGGPPAMLYAHRNPQRVDKLVFFGSFSNGGDIAPPEIQSALHGLVAAYWGLGSKALLDLFDPDMDSEQRTSLSKIHKRSTTAAMAADLLQLTFTMDARTEARNILTVALVLHRDADTTVHADAGRSLAASLPNAQFKTLTGKAHLPWTGNDQQVVIESILAFTTGKQQASRASAHPPRCQFQHLGDVWALAYEDTTLHIKDSLGMRDLATLIIHAGQEVSAQFLVNGEEEAPAEQQAEILDKQAIGEYRQRLSQLTQEKEDAAALGDEQLYARLEQEEDAITLALRGALGLAGQQRVFSNDQEKARKAISARVRASIKRIEALHPALGEHLRENVRTGVFCQYSNPDKLHWQL